MQETAAGSGRRLPAQFFELSLSLIERHFLKQDGLGQNVERIGACANAPLDQIVGIAIDGGRGRIANPLGEAGYQVSFLLSHVFLRSLNHTKESAGKFLEAGCPFSQARVSQDDVSQ
jgi:hypothetical protein